MWKKIDTQLVISGMIVSHIITDNPNDPKDQYVVKTVRNDYIVALHANGESALKLFPKDQLLNGTWWVKDGK
jgi:hypothetical protein